MNTFQMNLFGPNEYHGKIERIRTKKTRTKRTSSANFLVMAEIYRKGFIIGAFDSLEEAIIVYEKNVDLSSLYEFKDMPKMATRHKRYRNNEILGDLYLMGYQMPIHGSNGALSVYVLDTEGDDLKSFISEFIGKREFQTAFFI